MLKIPQSKVVLAWSGPFLAVTVTGYCPRRPSSWGKGGNWSTFGASCAAPTATVPEIVPVDRPGGRRVAEKVRSSPLAVTGRRTARPSPLLWSGRGVTVTWDGVRRVSSASMHGRDRARALRAVRGEGANYVLIQER